MMLAVNPILLNSEDEKVNDAKLLKLREQMEDPANKLNIDDELRIKDDIKDQIYKIKKNICNAIIEEDKSINLEIRQLYDNKITME